MTEWVPVKRALISLSDKSGLDGLATGLERHKIEIVSTGGTAAKMREAGAKVRDVSDLTGFPEMMDGRVKTLHPKVHGGLLAVRDNADHVRAMSDHEIPVNRSCRRQSLSLSENRHERFEPRRDYRKYRYRWPVDGSLRGENHAHVAVVTDPAGL